jgi:hypothetical protein
MRADVITLVSLVLFPLSSSLLGEQLVSAALSQSEKETIGQRIVSNGEKVKSLWVDFDRIATSTNNGVEKKTIQKYTWGFSGGKIYRKRSWPSEIGQPLSSRWGVAVWDGNVLKSYDSKSDNGSVRREYDPQNNKQPPTYSPYAQHLGHLTRGTLATLLRNIPSDKWSAEWVIPGKTVAFSCAAVEGDTSGIRHTWVVDTQKGYAISEYRIEHLGPDGRWIPVLSLVVAEFREIEPGVWLPVRSHAKYTPMGGGVYEQDIVASNVEVNVPSIDERFHFTYPKGSQYYDFTLHATVIPNATEKAFQKQLVDMSDELSRVVEEEKLGGNLPSSAPASHPAAGPVSSTNMSSSSRVAWVVGVCIFGALVVVAFWVIRRRSKS